MLFEGQAFCIDTSDIPRLRRQREHGGAVIGCIDHPQRGAPVIVLEPQPYIRLPSRGYHSRSAAEE
jgi:hypothetical protein